MRPPKDISLAQHNALAARSGTMRELLTIRIVGLLELLRRSGTIANQRELGLSRIEWRIMAQVGGYAPLSLNDLAELCGLDRGQLSRAVKAMAQQGLLISRRRPGGPAIMITLSDEGQVVHDRMVALAIDRNRFVVGDLSDETLEQFGTVLDEVTRKAQLLLERVRATSERQPSERQTSGPG
ncbi:MAG: MarR family protein [Sphingomonas bacterium]|nr:MarR family transcriptional regulator [Sphingomonas bacterium]MDB5688293.1 MarR family protein [Sphingomonas bacterium]